MGTRNITAVMHDGKYKIAQYGQWDGYPSGQGKTALEFCRKYLDTAAGRAAFVRSLGNVSFVDQKAHEKLWADIGVDLNANGGYVDMNQSAKFAKLHPQLDRDMGAKILAFVFDAKKQVPLEDSIGFAGDSLFCEWAYVVDLDKCTFEVFKGFNKGKLDDGARFAKAPKDGERDNGYEPIRLLVSYPLDDLPTVAKFLELEKEDEAAAS